jgi:hypothetical protein
METVVCFECQFGSLRLKPVFNSFIRVDEKNDISSLCMEWFCKVFHVNHGLVMWIQDIWSKAFILVLNSILFLRCCQSAWLMVITDLIYEYYCNSFILIPCIRDECPPTTPCWFTPGLNYSVNPCTEYHRHRPSWFVMRDLIFLLRCTETTLAAPNSVVNVYTFLFRYSY